MRRVALLLLGLVPLLKVTGCIVLPLPPLGAQIGPDEIETIRPGVSTREQVHEVLGEPNVTIVERYEIFDVSEERYNWLIFGGLPPYVGGGTVPVDERLYRVLADYESDGMLRELHWEGNAPSEEPLPRVTWPDSLYGAVTASPSGRLLAQSSGYYFPLGVPALVLHDGSTGAAIAQVEAMSGCQLLGFNSDDTTLLYRLNGQSRWSFPVVTMFLSDGQHLASVAARDTVCIWNAETRMGVRELGVAQGLRGLATARSAPTVAALDAKGDIRVWHGLSGSLINTIATCRSKDRCSPPEMVLSDDGRLLATLQVISAPIKRFGMLWRYDPLFRGVQLWEVRTGTELVAFDLSERSLPPWNIALSPDLRRVAVHYGGHIEIWRVNETPGQAWQEEAASRTTPGSAGLERVLILPPVDDVITAHHSLAFSADGRKFAAGYASAIVWEVGSWKEIWRAPSAETYLQSFDNGFGFIFTADGRRILSGCCSWEVPALAASLQTPNRTLGAFRGPHGDDLRMGLSGQRIAKGDRSFEDEGRP